MKNEYGNLLVTINDNELGISHINNIIKVSEDNEFNYLNEDVIVLK